MSPVILWFRQDLRLSDHPALEDAIQSGQPVLPLFILEEATEAHPSAQIGGGASRWWLHHSLAALQKKLPSLCLLKGDPALLIPDLIAKTGATEVFWTRRYDPFGMLTDTLLKKSLQDKGVKALSFKGSLLNEPWTLTNASHKPFQVFTPYWKHCLKETPLERPLSAPPSFPVFSFPSDSLKSWKLLPRNPDWAAGFAQYWTPGEEGAQKRLSDFLNNGLQVYSEQRNQPAQEGTSRLSPHLHWGEISPRQIWYAVKSYQQRHPGSECNCERYLAEIGWREFSYSLLYHHPQLSHAPLQSGFNAFPWQDDGDILKAWQQGQTGYPLVDAGMRQLWHTGWMHNRVRMVVASFLVKHLLISWQAGLAWFQDTLVDADLANNTANWQWVAGCGADAAPYFRIFNPVLQGEKFDPQGAYVRQWVPELQNLPDAFIHKPWLAPATTLQDCKIRPGITYPYPLVDHKAARTRALELYHGMKKTSAVEKIMDELPLG